MQTHSLMTQNHPVPSAQLFHNWIYSFPLLLKNFGILVGFKISKCEVQSYKIRDFIPLVKKVLGFLNSFPQMFKSKDLPRGGVEYPW